MDAARRKFLLSTLGATGTMALSNLLTTARASNANPTVTDQHFVFAHFLGGWDAILTVDPKDPEIYDDNELTVAEFGVETGYGSLGFTDDPRIFTDVDGLIFGPYIGDLADFAARISVVRGMTITSVAHGSATIHLNTGKTPAGTGARGSSIATILASILGENQMMPNLVSGVGTYNLDRPSWASGLRASNIRDLKDLLGPGISALEREEKYALDEFFDRELQRTNTPRRRSIFQSRDVSRMLIEEDVASEFDVENEALAPLIERMDNGAALMAYQALTKGYSRCVSFQAMPFSDAHAGNYWRNLHRWHLLNGFNSIAKLASELDATPYPTGGTWLDHTTIVCSSEFNRTPFLNATGGRDHGTTNSALLLGGGIAGGKVIGETHQKSMVAQPIDLATGMVDENGSTVSHENIAVTLIKSLGITEDVGDFRVPAIDALLPGVE